MTERQQALEEAAKICEENKLISGSIGPLMDMGWACCQEACAKAIRQAMQDTGTAD